MGTAIIGVSQTGDFQGRHQKRVIELYRRFSEANTLLPRTVAFAFDRECLREAEQRDLERMAPGLVKFLPRRMYESYLLDASAIAATANSVEGFRATPVREEEIQILIDAKRVDRRYYCQGTTSIPDEWIIKIDSAKMLTEMFDELSETRVRYDKMRHSVSITEWLLDNRPIVLEELSNWLVALFQKDEDIHTGALT
jgi:hypothetical protein